MAPPATDWAVTPEHYLLVTSHHSELYRPRHLPATRDCHLPGDCDESTCTVQSGVWCYNSHDTCDKLTSTDSTSHFIVPLSILLRPQTLNSILAGVFIQENVNIYTALSFVYNIHRCYMQYYDCQFQTRSLVRSSEDASVRILSRGEGDL